MSSGKNSARANEIYAAIWLIGLGILFWTGYFWPGILILIGATMLVRAFLPVEVSSAKSGMNKTIEPKESLDDSAPWEEEEEEPVEPAFVKPVEKKSSFPVERLPEACPNCGGPVKENAHKVEWTNEKSCKCPFCETLLTIN